MNRDVNVNCEWVKKLPNPTVVNPRTLAPAGSNQNFLQGNFTNSQQWMPLIPNQVNSKVGMFSVQ